MSKIKMLGAAFLAVLAFGAVSAVAANAAPQWLQEGSAITSPLAATTTGTWKLIGKQFFGFVETEVNCTGKLFGTVGAGAADQTTEVEDNHGHRGGNGVKLECVVGTKNGGCVSGETAIVEPEHMPWSSKLVAGTTTPKDEFAGGPGEEPGFTVTCNKNVNTCEGNSVSDELTNLRGGTVEGNVLKALSKSCSAGGTAETSAKGTTALNNGKALTVTN